MKLLKISVSLSLATLALAPPVGAKTYTCTAVDKKASLGVSDRSSVSVTSGEKTCQFAVDGESVNAQRTADFRMQLNRVLDFRSIGYGGGAFGSNDIEALQLLVMGPNYTDGSVRFRNSFGSRANDVSQCLQSRGERDIEDRYSGILCRAFRPEDFKRKAFGDVSVDSNVKILVLSVTMDRMTYTLFIPFPLLDAGELGFRFR